MKGIINNNKNFFSRVYIESILPNPELIHRASSLLDEQQAANKRIRAKPQKKSEKRLLTLRNDLLFYWIVIKSRSPLVLVWH